MILSKKTLSIQDRIYLCTLNENGLPEATLRKSTKMEVNELRGIVIKLFYHTLALLHFTFFFISQTLPSGWVKNMLFLPHFEF